MQALGQVRQVHHVGAKAPGQLFATLERAVGDRHGLGVFGGKVGGAQLNHLARAHKQHLDLRQVFKQLPGQAHRCCGHADGVGANFGRAAHLFGHGKRALKQLRQRAAQGASGVGSAHRVFELAQNLRLAQHHGVEPAGHPKGVARGLAVGQAVGVRAQRLHRHAARLRQPGQGVFEVGFVACAVNFGAVAGGNDGCLRRLGHGAAQALEVRLDHVQGERKPATQVQRCGGVVDSECPDCHISVGL